MAQISEDIRSAVDAAFDYRGHVTITFVDGKTFEGFVSNRVFENPNLPEDNFIEAFPKNSEELQRFKIESIKSINLSGKDYAESFEEYQKRTGGS